MNSFTVSHMYILQLASLHLPLQNKPISAFYNCFLAVVLVHF